MVVNGVSSQLATDIVLNIDTLIRQGGKSDSNRSKLVTRQAANSVDDKVSGSLNLAVSRGEGSNIPTS